MVSTTSQGCYLISMDVSSAFPILLRPVSLLFVNFLHGGIDCNRCGLPFGFSSNTTTPTLAPFSTSHRVSWSISFGVHFTHNDAGRSPPQGAASLCRVATAQDLVRFTFCSGCHEEVVAVEEFNIFRRSGVQSLGFRLARGVRCGRLLSWMHIVTKCWRGGTLSKCAKVG